MVHLKGKVDAIVMSAGVGENSPPVRQLLLADLEASPPSTFILPVGSVLSCYANILCARERLHVTCRPLGYLLMRAKIGSTQASLERSKPTALL